MSRAVNRGKRSRVILTAFALVLSAFASVATTARPVEAATNKTVVIGMPFDGAWASSASGKPSTHDRYWGQWAVDLFAYNTDVYLHASAPNGGTLSFAFGYNSDSCAGDGVVINVYLDGTYVGAVYYEHLANEITGGPITNGMKLGTTLASGANVPPCYYPNGNQGVHTHFEAKSDSGNYACWVNYDIGTQLDEGDPIARIGKTNATGVEQACTGSVGGASHDEVGVRDGNHYFLNYNNDTDSEFSFYYGAATDTPFAGDWDGDGEDEVGIRSGNHWFLNYDNDSDSEASFYYASAGDTIIVGDWDNDNRDEVGVKIGNHYFLNYDNDTDSEASFYYASAADTPIVGDWDGDGDDNVGVKIGNAYFYNYDNDGDSENSFQYASAGDTPFTGDWDGDGEDEVGIRSGNHWFLNYDNDTDSEFSFYYGTGDEAILTGDWDGD